MINHEFGPDADLDLRDQLAADAASADANDISAHLTEQEFIRDCLDAARRYGLEGQVVQTALQLALRHSYAPVDAMQEAVIEWDV